MILVTGGAGFVGANFVLDWFKATEVAPIPTSAYPTPAWRPLNSRLDTSRLQSTFGLTLPPWQQGVARMLAEIL